MSRVRSIHHVNFLVKDLGASAARFSVELGLEFGAEELLPERGVATRRVKIDGTWLVLVQPLDANNPIGRRLAEKGEGVFLLSFGVDSLDAMREPSTSLGAERRGLDGWRVADLAGLPGDSTVLQVCEDKDC